MADEEYKCGRCGYTTENISNIRRHVVRKQVCKPKVANVPIEEQRKKFLPDDKDKDIICKDCGKKYSSRQGLYLHIRDDKCTKNKDSKINALQNIIEQIQKELMDIKQVQERIINTTSNQPSDAMGASTSYQSTSQINVTPKNMAKIPYSIRCKSWITHIGAEVGQTTCLCCKENTITQFKFTCGHIISRADGGTLAMDNLRPICNDCNNDMGNENMREFALRIHNVVIL